MAAEQAQLRQERMVDWGWIFGALWSLSFSGRQQLGTQEKRRRAANETDQEQRQISNGVVKLNVPDTVLFRNGAPYKWLSSNEDGILVRKQVQLYGNRQIFDNARAPGVGDRKASGGGVSVLIRQQIEDLVGAFANTTTVPGPSGRNACPTTTDQNVPTCVAYYEDGKSEALSRQELAKLSCHERWRKQLVGLQSYIHPTGRRTGMYSTDQSSTSAECDASGEANYRSVAVDAVTKSVAMYAERAYSANSNKSDYHGTKSNGITIISLDAEYIIDDNNKLWFSHAKQVVVRYGPASNKADSVKSFLQGINSASEEANKAAKELKTLLRLAFNRKVSTQTCFGHFDQHGEGCVDAGGLRAGLSRLGVTVTHEASEILLCLIGKASGLHFRARDLVEFAIEPYVETGGDHREGLKELACSVDVPYELDVDLHNESAEKVEIDEGLEAGLVLPHHLVVNNSRNEYGDEEMIDAHALSSTKGTDERNQTSSVLGSKLPGATDFGDIFDLNYEDAFLSPSPTSKASEIASDAEVGQIKTPSPPTKEEPLLVSEANVEQPLEGPSSALIATPIECDPAGMVDANLLKGGAPTLASTGVDHLVDLSLASEPTADARDSLSPASSLNNEEHTTRALVMRLRQEALDGAKKQKRLAEHHSMRQEDKKSLEAYRKCPERDAAWDESAERCRSKVEELRGIRQEEEQRVLELNASRLRAITREQLRLNGPKELKEQVGLSFEEFQSKATFIKMALREKRINEAKEELAVLNSDVTLCVDSLERAKLKQRKADKADLTRREAEKAEGEARVLRRTVQFAKTNERSTSLHDLEAIERQYAHAQSRASEARALFDAEREELSKCNDAVQSHLIPWRQKKNTLKDVAPQMANTVDEYKVEIARLRQQKEGLEQEAAKLEEAIDKSSQRLQSVDREQQRVLEQASTKSYVDTDLGHQGGNVQRMASLKDFENIVQTEKASVQDGLTIYRQQLDQTLEAITCIESTILQCSRLQVDLCSMHANLCGVDQGSALLGRESISGGIVSSTLKEGGKKSIATRVRTTSEESKSTEEKEWASMDCRINPDLYAAKYVPDPSCNLELDKDGVNKLLNLPEQLQLAIPFLRSERDLKAHYLLQKYTRDRGELYFHSLDKQRSGCSDQMGVINMHANSNHVPEPALVRIQDDGTPSRTNVRHRSIAEQILTVPVEPDSEEERQPRVVSSIDDLVDVNDDKAARSTALYFVSSSNVASLLDVPSILLSRGERRRHQFVVIHDSPQQRMFQSMTVTVVLRGVSSSTDCNFYTPGRISVSLGRLEGPNGPQPVGYAPYQQQVVNTTKAMGRIVIEHEPASVITAGLFEIKVVADSDTRYSVSVTGKSCDRAELVLQRSLASFLTKRECIGRYNVEDSTLWTDMRIAERKIGILQNLIEEAEAETERCESDIERCDMELEADATDDELNQVYDAIKVLELEFSHWTRVLSTRLHLRGDAKESVDQMANMRREKLKSAKELKHTINKLKRVLPLSAALVFDRETAAKVADICESEFDMQNAMASGTGIERVARDISLLCSTPGEKLRRLARREGGLDSLTVEEKKWCTIDMSLNPGKWEWQEGEGVSKVVAESNVPSRTEVERIRSTPFDQLRRRQDKEVKHLLLKYHDDLSRTRAATASDKTQTNGDLLAARARSKPPQLYSTTDYEWQSIDILLNPSAWKWRFGGNTSLVSNTGNGSIKRWKCPFAKSELLKIWASKESDLSNDDERRTRILLDRYNGSPHDHVDTTSEEGNTIQGRSRWEPQTEQDGLANADDPDVKCRLVLAELERAVHCRDDFLVSSVLHVVPQKYPTHILRLELERELDRLLKEQIFALEHDYNVARNSQDHDDHDTESTSESITTNSTGGRGGNGPRTLLRDTEVVQTVIDEKCARDLAKREEARRLGFGGCLACNTVNRCHHQKYLDDADEDALKRRRDELSSEILSVHNLSARNGGPTHFNRADITDDLNRELKEINNRISLSKVDLELHAAHASLHAFVEVESLHGFSTYLATEDAVQALQREQDRLIAISVADEVVEGILDWMLDGWYFGERELYAHVGHIEERKDESSSSFGPPGQLSELIAESKQRNQIAHIARDREQRRSELDQTETNVKFGLFCLTFMYFRQRHLVRLEKESLSGQNALVGGKAVQRTRERKQMMQEKENAGKRKELLRRAMEKAEMGEERMRLKRQDEDAMRAKMLRFNYRKEALEKRSALMIQRVFRGHLGRLAASMWAIKMAEMEASNCLFNACATTISSAYRGTLARREARALRKTMAEYIIALRAEDLKEDMEHWKPAKRRFTVLSSFRHKSQKSK